MEQKFHLTVLIRGVFLLSAQDSENTPLYRAFSRSKVIIGIHNYMDKYSLLEIQLITGRTHQIRAHLASIGYPIIGDIKYGDREVNKYFKENFGLNNQMLHAYKLIFNKLDKPLDYLDHKEFIASSNKIYKNIEERIF